MSLRKEFQGLALDLIAAEREAQDEKWGTGRVLPAALWCAVLGEEYGEVAKEVCECTTTEGQQPLDREARGRLIEELVQTAAVAVSWLEQLLEETSDD
jgi:hypothetical protein